MDTISLPTNAQFHRLLRTYYLWWWFTTSYLPYAPLIEILYTSQLIYLYILNLFIQLPFSHWIYCVLWLYDYFQWCSVSDISVIVVVFLFIPPWIWPHTQPKHVGGYCVIKTTSKFYCAFWYWYCTQNYEHISSRWCWSPVLTMVGSCWNGWEGHRTSGAYSLSRILRDSALHCVSYNRREKVVGLEKFSLLVK